MKVKGPKGVQQNREVSVEHILEWQLLTKFLESDKNLGEASICAHLSNFWTKGVTIDTVWPDVVSKDKNDQEKKENTPVKIQEKQAIDWIAHQIPGVTASGSPYMYEFVHLENLVNGVKKKVSIARWVGKHHNIADKMSH